MVDAIAMVSISIFVVITLLPPLSSRQIRIITEPADRVYRGGIEPFRTDCGEDFPYLPSEECGICPREIINHFLVPDAVEGGTNYPSDRKRHRSFEQRFAAQSPEPGVGP